MKCDLLHNKPGRCDWCGKHLTGKQRRWCSRQCGRSYRKNHRWTDAREEARKQAAWYLCNRCGYLYQQHDINVNHIEPVKGKHSQFGCWHHQTNLEVVCVDCHAMITTEQRQQGLI